MNIKKKPNTAVQKVSVTSEGLTKKVVVSGIVAALYVALTLAFAPLSFMTVQFRFSELMTLLVFIDPGYGAGLILGCAIANFFSPLGIIDVVIGTLSTAAAVWGIKRSRSLFIATLWPTVSCILVGAEISYIYALPFVITTLSVMAGEFAVVTILGYPIFRWITKNKALMKSLALSG